MTASARVSPAATALSKVASVAAALGGEQDRRQHRAEEWQRQHHDDREQGLAAARPGPGAERDERDQVHEAGDGPTRQARIERDEDERAEIDGGREPDGAGESA